ncbi:MAG: hypothetical protein KF706_07095 [Chitinophagales bacterium]|nr:hypothetical protein [Chitinophagales bacterium]
MDKRVGFRNYTTYRVSSHFGINLESGMQLYGIFPKGGSSNGVFSTYGRVGGRFYF